MRFPTLVTRDLEGRDRRLPDDLEGDVAVVLVAFQRWHQRLVDSWMPLLRSLEAAHPGLTVWEVPALSWTYLPGRFYIDGGMRAGIPDPRARTHTLTAYTDLRALARALDLDGFDTIHVFVLAPGGEILARAEGGLVDDSGRRIAGAIASVASPTSPPA